MIAEDEDLERYALYEVIIKNREDCDVLLAKNGREALALASQNIFDIVLLDIKMPGMDGLEVAKRIRATNDKVAIAFLTAWGSFEYAKVAISLGAIEYLVKPIDDNDVLKVLDTCIKRRNLENKTLYIPEKEFYVALRYGTATEELIEAFLASKNISSSKGLPLLINCSKDENITGVFSSIFAFSDIKYCFFEKANYVVLLLFASDIGKIKYLINKELSKNGIVGIGIPFFEKAQISDSISKANIAYEIACERNLSVVDYLTLPPREIEQFFSVSETSLIHKLHNAILVGDEVLAYKSAKHLIDTAIFKNYPIKKISEEVSVIRYMLLRDIPFLMCDSIVGSTFFELETSLITMIDCALASVKQDKKDKYGRQFEIIKKYIKMHYSEQLSVEMLADILKLNKFYFSKLFSVYFGKTFVEYLTDVRMENARKMLKEGKSVKETAELTGFANQNYFARVFKNYYGIAPTLAKTK